MGKHSSTTDVDRGPQGVRVVETKGRTGLRFTRAFTTAGVHPYDELEWELRDAVLTNWRDGSVSFEQRGVEFPTSWSMMATQIVSQKYFRGQLGTPQRERSVRQMIDRVADTIAGWGIDGGYFADAESAEVFNAELKHLLVICKSRQAQASVLNLASFTPTVATGWCNSITPMGTSTSSC